MSDSTIVVRRLARSVATLAPALLLFVATSATAQPVSLGSAESFAVLGGTSVSNTGASAVTGDVGVSPTGTVTGFPPGTVTGATHDGDAVAVQALLAAEGAFDAIAARACRPINDLTGQNLGGKSLAPGTYCFDADAPLTGTLTLTGMGPWTFQIGGMLTIDANAQVLAPAVTSTCKGSLVNWQVGGSAATVGAAAMVIGNILTDGDITLAAGAILDGRALAFDGDVTMATNTVAACSFGGTFPPHTPIKVTGGGQVSVPDPDESHHRRRGHGRATFAFVAIPGTTGDMATGRFVYLNHSSRGRMFSFPRMHVFGDVEHLAVVAVNEDGTPRTVRFDGSCFGRPDCTFSVLVEDNSRREDDRDDDDDEDDVDDDDDDDKSGPGAADHDHDRPRDKFGVVVVAGGRIVEARALRPIARGNIQFHRTATGPALSNDVNDVEFRPGQAMNVAVSLDPGPTAMLADAYVVLQLPNGQFMSWTGGGLVPGLVPIARGFVPFPFRGSVAQIVVPRGAPAGRYTWLSGLTAAGTLNVLTPISTSVFTITP